MYILSGANPVHGTAPELLLTYRILRLMACRSTAVVRMT